MASAAISTLKHPPHSAPAFRPRSHFLGSTNIQFASSFFPVNLTRARTDGSANRRTPRGNLSITFATKAVSEQTTSATPATSATSARPKAKICGVTSEEDAAFAAANGAAFVGMILWPKAKRSIALPVAARVAAAARSGGAVPVGVFVDENAAEIEAACREAGVFVAQVWLLDGNDEKLSPCLTFHRAGNGGDGRRRGETGEDGGRQGEMGGDGERRFTEAQREQLSLTSPLGYPPSSCFTPLTRHAILASSSPHLFPMAVHHLCAP
ncbi:unnamed protein product [Closterium sp. NIES-64]|nr:unnamed protein product [Closterium sp. NIES-64]